jgi:hypothetical protein
MAITGGPLTYNADGTVKLSDYAYYDDVEARIAQMAGQGTSQLPGKTKPGATSPTTPTATNPYTQVAGMSFPAGYLVPTGSGQNYATWLADWIAKNQSQPTAGAAAVPGAATSGIPGAGGINRTPAVGTKGPSAQAYAHANPNAAFLRAINPDYVKTNGKMPGGTNPFTATAPAAVTPTELTVGRTKRSSRAKKVVR